MPLPRVGHVLRSGMHYLVVHLQIGLLQCLCHIFQHGLAPSPEAVPETELVHRLAEQLRRLLLKLPHSCLQGWMARVDTGEAQMPNHGLGCIHVLFITIA